MSRNFEFMERRKHKRYQVRYGAFTANAARAGLITDISLGGLSVRYIDRKRWPVESTSLNIICDDTGFCLENIPFKVVCDCPADHDNPDSSLVVKRLGVEFGTLSAGQKAQLKEFISRNIACEEEHLSAAGAM